MLCLQALFFCVVVDGLPILGYRNEVIVFVVVVFDAAITHVIFDAVSASVVFVCSCRPRGFGCLFLLRLRGQTTKTPSMYASKLYMHLLLSFPAAPAVLAACSFCVFEGNGLW